MDINKLTAMFKNRKTLIDLEDEEVGLCVVLVKETIRQGNDFIKDCKRQQIIKKDKGQHNMVEEYENIITETLQNQAKLERLLVKLRRAGVEEYDQYAEAK